MRGKNQQAQKDGSENLSILKTVRGKAHSTLESTFQVLNLFSFVLYFSSLAVVVFFFLNKVSFKHGFKAEYSVY